MLKHISWTTYFETIIFLLIIYYVFILVKYYGAELRGLLRRGKAGDTGNPQIPEVLRYEAAEQPVDQNIIISTSDRNPDNQPDSSLEEADQLIGQLKKVIQAASGKPFSPAVLIPQIKKLFRDYLALRQSPHRPAINELVVSECERLGTALLTEDEVDQWWNE